MLGFHPSRNFVGLARGSFKNVTFLSQRDASLVSDFLGSLWVRFQSDIFHSRFRQILCSKIFSISDVDQTWDLYKSSNENCVFLFLLCT